MRSQTKWSVIAFVTLLLFVPGFNQIQQYHLRPFAKPIFPPPFTIPTEATVPVAVSIQRPQLTAKGAIVIDQESGAILYAKNPDTQLYPASLTKLMTALVALDSYPLDAVLEITEESDAIGNTIHLQRGERISVQNLLKGLLIASGNDAAFALARSYPAGYDGFVQKMNEKARQLHMNNTTYRNVSGVEQEGHLTTVRDMATLTKEALKHPFVSQTVATQKLIISDVDGRFTHELETTNKLLGVVPGVEGVKTGWTTEAGECLITKTMRNGHSVITVVLGSEDRFGESAQLISWAFGQHKWKHYSLEDWLGGRTAGTYP
ncbi:MAG TPA: D-alanyl-D-alanine carboxypeptidase family protein [Patescibacteria group bacterium]|nr:D-alanyl-D-alanine carboxypeptidase family protein [Patescibacteria group bacterium]